MRIGAEGLKSLSHAGYPAGSGCDGAVIPIVEGP